MKTDIKSKILEFSSKLDESLSIGEKVDKILDHLIENGVIDMTEDLDGNIYFDKDFCFNSIASDIYTLIDSQSHENSMCK